MPQTIEYRIVKTAENPTLFLYMKTIDILFIMEYHICRAKTMYLIQI